MADNDKSVGSPVERDMMVKRLSAIEDTLRLLTSSLALLDARLHTLTHQYAAEVRTRSEAATASSDRQAATLLDRISSLAENRSELVAISVAEYTKAGEKRFDNIAAIIDEYTRAISQQLERVTEELLKRTTATNAVITGGNGMSVSMLDGLLVGVPSEELRLILYHAFYGLQEPGIIRYFSSIIKPGMIIADIGASVGTYTLKAARALCGSGHVYAFEPAPRTFEALVANLKYNAFFDSGIVSAHRTAILDHTGEETFHFYPGDFGLSSIYAMDGDGSSFPVNTDTLDDALADVSRLDVVKIDAEGSEPRILAGMERLLDASPDLIMLIEFAPSHLKRASADPAAFAERLLKLGFDLRAIDAINGEIRAVTVPELVSGYSTNLVLTRPTRNRPRHASRT